MAFAIEKSYSTLKNGRHAGIELFRIYCISVIVIMHMIQFSGIENSHPELKSIYNVVNSFFIFCVDGFVLITGYFLINAKCKFERIIRVLVEVVFWSFIIDLILMILDIGSNKITFSELLKSFYILGPTKYNQWFITKYIGLLILQPFLSLLAKGMSERQYKIFIVVFAILNLQFYAGFPFGELMSGPLSLMFFIFLFFLGGYLRLYLINTKLGKSKWVWSFLLLFCLIVHFMIINNGINIYTHYNSVNTVLMAVSAFILFFNLTVRNRMFNRFIEFISGHTLSIYVVHVHWYLMPVIISVFNLFLPSQDILLIIPYTIAFGLILVLLITILDKVRIFLFRMIKIPDLIHVLGNKLDHKLGLR